MAAHLDPILQLSIDALALPDITVGHRIISLGDEHALWPEEAESFAASVTKVRRASGAARIVARELLARLGYRERAVPKSTSGAPVWPEGVTGSLSHDPSVAIVAIGLSRCYRGLGIDIVEPTELLPPDWPILIATAAERCEIGGDECLGRLLFAAKEAVYKAVQPLDHVFLDHHDVEIDFATQKATVRNGR